MNTNTTKEYRYPEGEFFVFGKKCLKKTLLWALLKQKSSHDKIIRKMEINRGNHFVEFRENQIM